MDSSVSLESDTVGVFRPKKLRKTQEQKLLDSFEIEKLLESIILSTDVSKSSFYLDKMVRSGGVDRVVQHLSSEKLDSLLKFCFASIDKAMLTESVIYIMNVVLSKKKVLCKANQQTFERLLDKINFACQMITELKEFRSSISSVAATL